MKISFVEVQNFRKLKSTHISFDERTTIFVGANNSGKTSATVALRYFLVNPSRLTLRDITIANWPKIDAIGSSWKSESSSTNADAVSLDDLLPTLDIWIDVPVSKIHYVSHILPTLDWNGGLIGVRLKYKVKSIATLCADYIAHRSAAIQAAENTKALSSGSLQIWPTSLTDFLDRRLRNYIDLEAFSLDPSAHIDPEKGIATPQQIPIDAVPLEKNPFKHLIKIDEIVAQRDFSDAGGRDIEGEDAPGTGSRRYRRRLSDQLRAYYDKHLDPMKTPTAHDYEALSAIQVAERTFDTRLKSGFAEAFSELEDLGYPGVANPKLNIATQVRAIDGLNHSAALQYQIASAPADGRPLQLPEDYAGLGYQNLISMVFMLMSFRDDWMRVGKAGLVERDALLEEIQPLHLVLVEEPEAHLHAQVQQVFIKKAYGLLRNNDNLRDDNQYRTQLIVSTHSTHIAHEADFASLRYFRRRPATSAGESPTTTVANLSFIFGGEDETQRFVKRYLKATHCDLFFADGAIFAEGQAERILVPHFIRHHFPSLSSRYISVLEVGGSHAQRFKPLIDELGLTTLIITDLDAVRAEKKEDKNGKETTKWIATKPLVGQGQKTANSILKEWHPQKSFIDDLASLPDKQHECSTNDGYSLYIAFQKPVSAGKTGENHIPRTFEDALVFENMDVLVDLSGASTSEKVSDILKSGATGDELADRLFELIKGAEKAAFALDCLMMKQAEALRPPKYIYEGLTWMQGCLSSIDKLEALNQ